MSYSAYCKCGAGPFGPKGIRLHKLNRHTAKKNKKKATK